MDASSQLERLTKGCVEVVPEGALRAKLEKSIASKTPLRVKAGFDPSAPDIHLGHTVLLTKLRQFQDLGHKVILLIGDATARIGDPTGRSQTRPALSAAEVDKNARTYQDQAFRILDVKRTEVVYNGKWFGAFGFEDFMKLLSRVTVSQILQREDFAKRSAQNQPISLMEVFYPLMQAYDSVHLKSDIEVGGTDQKFNLLLGRELQKEFGQEPQVVMTLPLLVGLDGTQKMSKSLGNHIGVTDSPKEIFGKIMSVSDKLMIQYWDLLTDQSGGSIQKQIDSGRLHPKAAKEDLAALITARFWSEKDAEKTRLEFSNVFGLKDTPSDVPLLRLPKGERKLYKLVQECGLAPSSSEARRLVVQNAVSLDGKKVSDPEASVLVGPAEHFLKVGTRRFARFSAAS